MTPDEKKNLIAAKLSAQLRSMLPGLDSAGVARDLVCGIAGREGDSLWAVMAPLIDGVVLGESLERELAGYEGMPLSRTLIEEIMSGVWRAIAASSAENERGVRLRTTSRSHKTVGIWGGAGAMEGDSGE